MGRKLLTSAAVVAASLGMCAGTAFASTASPSISNGAKMTKVGQARFKANMQSAATAAAAAAGTGTAQVISHGGLAECTVPEPGGTYDNFFTKDTTNYLEYGGFVLVGDCSADLNDKQTGASANDKPIGKTLIPFTGYETYSEACNIVYKGNDFYGDAESIVYKDGEFVETCVVPLIID